MEGLPALHAVSHAKAGLTAWTQASSAADTRSVHERKSFCAGAQAHVLQWITVCRPPTVRPPALCSCPVTMMAEVMPFSRAASELTAGVMCLHTRSMGLLQPAELAPGLLISMAEAHAKQNICLSKEASVEHQMHMLQWLPGCSS